jgi:hypothetical protein
MIRLFALVLVLLSGCGSAVDNSCPEWEGLIGWKPAWTDCPGASPTDFWALDPETYKLPAGCAWEREWPTDISECHELVDRTSGTWSGERICTDKRYKCSVGYAISVPQ